MDTIVRRDTMSPIEGARVLGEGALVIAYELAGERREIASHLVQSIRREGHVPHLLERAQNRLARGDYAIAESRFAEIEKREDAPEWARIEARFRRASARALRARLEGEGHLEALELLQAFLAKHADHYFAPMAAVAAGRAALAARKLDEAKTLFGKLAGAWAKAAPYRFLGRVGLAQVTLARGAALEALSSFEAIEREALEDPFSVEASMRARLGRGEALVKLGRAREAAELLAEVANDEVLVKTPFHARVLNALAGTYADIAGRLPDGSAKPEAILAGMPHWFRVVRYGIGDPIERAQALAFSVRGCELTGRKEYAAMMRQELVSRFPTSRWAKAV